MTLSSDYLYQCHSICENGAKEQRCMHFSAHGLLAVTLPICRSGLLDFGWRCCRVTSIGRFPIVNASSSLFLE